MSTPARHVTELIDDLKSKHSLDESQIALVGFSQGAMVSLAYALNHTPQMAGVIAYSGAYIPDDTPPQSKPEVLMIHGAQDDVLPLDYYLASKDNLEKRGITVKGHIREGLAHGIDDWGIEAGHQFLTNKLYKQDLHQKTGE